MPKSRQRNTYKLLYMYHKWYVTKETYSYGKRDLPIWQKRPRPTYMAKGTYSYGKQVVHTWKEFMWQIHKAYTCGICICICLSTGSICGGKMGGETAVASTCSSFSGQEYWSCWNHSRRRRRRRRREIFAPEGIHQRNVKSGA